MKRSIAIILSVCLSALHAADWSSTPESLVRAFQADYMAWNNSAVALSETHGPLNSMLLVEREYAQLLRKYCLPDFKGEPIAYGTESSHDPSREKIVSAEEKGGRAVVRTEIRRSSAYTPNYEYELVKVKGRWFLLQVYLLDGGEKLPGL